MYLIRTFKVSVITISATFSLVGALLTHSHVYAQTNDKASGYPTSDSSSNTNLDIDQGSFQQGGFSNNSGFYNNFGDDDFKLSPTGCWTERKTFQASGEGQTNVGNGEEQIEVRVVYRTAHTDQGKICQKLKKIENQGEQEIKEIEKKIQEVKASVKNYETCVVDSETPEPTCREAFLDK